jgi:hypothetical protein
MGALNKHGKKPETTIRTLTKFTNSPVNLSIYKGLLARCFLMLAEWFSVGGGEETLFNKPALHIVEFRW